MQELHGKCGGLTAFEALIALKVCPAVHFRDFAEGVSTRANQMTANVCGASLGVSVKMNFYQTVRQSMK